MPGRRASCRGIAALLIAALGGCNFRPMLLATGGDDTAVSADLAAIEIRAPDDRLGFLVRDALLERLNPRALAVPARYVLDLRLRSNESKLGIQLDSVITRFNLTVTADVALRDKTTRDVLVDTTVRRVSSYNVSRLPYADLVASQTAERRAAEEVGIDIAMILGAFFAQPAPVT
jgi:LPS-assembly lipoprotein